jgi:predicted DNA-binding transcriptional regulator AlpA
MDDFQNTAFLNARQVRERYGNASHMFIVRAMRDKGFPQPTRFGGRQRYWRVSDLLNWERRMIGADAPAAKPRERKRRTA